MRFTCPTCGQLVEHEDDGTTGYVKCPSCRRFYFFANRALTNVPGWVLGIVVVLALRLMHPV